MLRVMGLLGLVLALAIAGLLIKRQLGGGPAESPPSTAAQAAQIQQQVKESLDAAVQSRRPIPDE